jgi:hypothetical protein
MGATAVPWRSLSAQYSRRISLVIEE